MLISTQRLNLRLLTPADLPDLIDFHGDSESVRYIPWQVRSQEDVKSWFERAKNYTSLRNEDGHLLLAIESAELGRVIGQVNASLLPDGNNTASVGYILAPQARGKGYATEAVRALVDFLFRDEAIHRVVLDIDVRNLRSTKLAERLGFRLEATHIENDFLKGEWCSMHVFALLSREWQSN